MIKMFVHTLSQLSIFKDLTEDQLGLLQAIIEPCSFAKETVIFEQGEPTQSLFIIVRGNILVRYKAYDGPVIEVARVGEGGIVGWSAALGRAAYTSGAVCLDDCDVYQINAAALHQLCEQNPCAGVLIFDRLAGAIADRLSSTHNQVMTILTQNADAKK